MIHGHPTPPVCGRPYSDAGQQRIPFTRYGESGLGASNASAANHALDSVQAMIDNKEQWQMESADHTLPGQCRLHLSLHRNQLVLDTGHQQLGQPASNETRARFTRHQPQRSSEQIASYICLACDLRGKPSLFVMREPAWYPKTE